MRVAATVVTILATAWLSGCAAQDDKGGSEITVDASDTGCAVSATQASTGSHTFVITNSGSKVTEFYVYGKDQKVVAEAENISPGLQRRLVVRFDEPGSYQTACKPGMVGDGIRGDFTVTR